jgi:hypothetical protein
MVTNPYVSGNVVEATYTEQEIPRYRGNPFIEALPPIRSMEEAVELMSYYPPYSPAERDLSPHVRQHLAAGLSEIRHPVGIHLELESRLSRLIRWGYASRNPISHGFQESVNESVGRIQESQANEGSARDLVIQPKPPRGAATGLTFLGTTGIGKTAGMQMVLDGYPQVIVHSDYEGRSFTRSQVVWLNLQCPSDGSIKTVCANFFGAMDAAHSSLRTQTNYTLDFVKSRSTIRTLVPSMARVAAQHGLGLLVLDEVQDLRQRGSRELLSFLVQLVNEIGVPVVLIGGVDALPALSDQFRQARRGATEGDLVVGPAENGTAWRQLCEVFWRYQYTSKETPMTQAHVDALFECSQGITQYLVTVYKLAQIRAISTGMEEVTPALIRSVARDGLVQAGPVLRTMKRGDRELLDRLGDVLPPEGTDYVPFLRGDPENEPSTDPEETQASDSSTEEKSDKSAENDEVVEGDSAGRATPEAAEETGATKKPVAKKDVSGLPDLLEKKEDETSAHERLTDEGIVGGNTWKEIAGDSQ